MKLRVTEGTILVHDGKELKAGDTFECPQNDTLQAWLDAGHVKEVKSKAKKEKS